jgi:heme exporter protein C
MQKAFPFLLVIVAAMFAYAPVLIVGAPYESTMGLVQKIFYFHVPSWVVMFTSGTVCGVASIRFLMTGRKEADRLALAAAELTLLFGLIGLMTGPLWARKAWGVWWQWDAKLTSALVMWLIFAAYILLRRFGGPGSEKLAAVVGIFGMANWPFVYWSVNIWRTVHPLTTVVPTLPAVMLRPLLFCIAAFLGLYLLMLTVRVHLERRRAELETLFLAVED